MDTISIEIRRFNINQSNDNIEISNHQAFSSKNNILTSGRSPINGRILIKTPEYGIIEEEKYKYGREIHLLAQIRHKNIIPFLGICEIERMTYCVVIEYMEGTSLHEVMRKGEQYSQRHVYSWVYQAARALSYLHTLLIAHLDIKPQNLLIDPDRKIVKLCDFDSAIKMDVGKPVDLTTCSFTNYFLDTNVKPGEVSVSRVLSMDIYSLAVTTWVILQKPVKITLKNDEGYRPDSITADIPSKLIDTKVITDPETAEFIESAWDSDAEKRPSACQFRIFMRKKRNECRDTAWSFGDLLFRVS